MIFADRHCPECGNLCGNHGGDRYSCSCGWVSEPLDFTPEPHISTPIGEWLKKYRRDHGIPLWLAAEAMDIKPSGVSAIEYRGRIPSVDELKRFARAAISSAREYKEMLDAQAETVRNGEL